MRRLKLWSTSLVMLGATTLILAAGCRDTAEDEDDEAEASSTPPASSGGGGGSGSESATVPQVGTISLNTLGTGASASALRLTASEDDVRCNQGDLGVMGLALGGACHTAPLAAQMLVGRADGDFDGDGDMDCDDLPAAKAAGKDAGLLLHLICEDIMTGTDNVTSLAFRETDGAFGISFADFDNGNQAVGSWTHGNAASYPADIRVWKGDDFASLGGIVGIGLESLNQGTVQVSFDGSGGGHPMDAKVSFSNHASGSGCAAAPGESSCHWQEVRIYAGEAAITNGPPNGFHLKVYADDKKAPTFLALEGKYRFSADGAAAFGGADNPCRAGFDTMRTVYFQVVQKGGQVWGRFAFRDGAGELIDCSGFGANVFQTLAADAGVCQNLGSSQWTTCTDVTAADYSDLWTGEADFESVTASPVTDVWSTGAPAQAGICTTAGCTPF